MELAAALAERGAGACRLAIVCGSGLAALAGVLERPQSIAFEELGALPPPRVPGHAGRFVLGEVGGHGVLVQVGRLHLYEGWSAAEVALPVRAYGRLGLAGVLLTNAAGGLHPAWGPGTLMRIVDHLNLQGRSPLARAERRAGPVYDPALGEALEGAAAAAGIELARGVYAGLLGPAYETPAEIAALARLGADAVGMSTVAEACAARAAGLRVAGLSVIANPAAGLAPGPLDHAAVLAAVGAASERLVRLVARALPGLLEELLRPSPAPLPEPG